MEILTRRESDECGCHEEELVINGMFVVIHLEPDSSGHIFIDCGDWEDEKLVSCNGIEDLRKKAEEWVLSFPVLDI